MDEKIKNRAEDGFALFARLFLAAVFLWSGIHHLQDTMAFAVKVLEYDILPSKLALPFAKTLPWVMVTSSGLLIIGLLTRPAAAAQALSLISFMIAVGINVYRDRVLGCGCFSTEGNQVSWLLVTQDFGLFLMAAYLAWRGGRSLCLDRLIWGRPGGGNAVLPPEQPVGDEKTAGPDV